MAKEIYKVRIAHPRGVIIKQFATYEDAHNHGAKIKNRTNWDYKVYSITIKGE